MYVIRTSEDGRRGPARYLRADGHETEHWRYAIWRSLDEACQAISLYGRKSVIIFVVKEYIDGEIDLAEQVPKLSGYQYHV